MKILLVKPYNSSDHIQPSLGLGYLATAVRTKSQVRILDCIKEGIRPAGLGRVINKYKPDIVGFQCYTADLRAIKAALDVVKEAGKKIVTVVGGPHPSAMPEETMRYFGDALDFVFKGECEKSFSDFIDQMANKEKDWRSVPGLSWIEEGKILSNDVYLEGNLDILGSPAWDLLCPENYPESQHGAFFKNFPIAPIMLTRGCPYPCTFCAGKLVSGTTLRKRSIPRVIEEILFLYKERGIREFHIVDDNFTLDIGYAKAFLRELIRQDLGISWAAPNGVRLDSLDEELLELMKKSGLYLLSVGIESGSDKTLASMRKGLRIREVREKVSLVKSFDIDVAGFFILGYPGETKEEISKTIDFSLKLGLLRANYFTFLPFPGTESYAKLAANGELGRVDWDRFSFMNAAYAPSGVTRRKLRQWQRLAFFRFYSRPGILIKNFLRIKSPSHFFYLFKRFLRWMAAS